MSDASDQYQAGLALKAQGDSDAALTAFRRALISEPNHPEANRETALLLRDRSRRDPNLKRPAYEALRKASLLSLDDEKLHDAYIVSAQESARLDEALIEYERLCHAHPENGNLKRCYRNLAAITIAMVPKPKEERRSNPKAKKFWYFISFNLVGSGIFSLVTPMLAARSGMIAGDASDVVLALTFLFAGIAAFIFARRA